MVVSLGNNLTKVKSNFRLGNGADYRRTQIKMVSGINEVSLPFTYLGIPLFKGKPLKDLCYVVLKLSKPSLKGGKGKFYP